MAIPDCKFMGSDECRLCGGRTLAKFQRLVLGQYWVWYSECERCCALQTERPFWLEEAYQSSLTRLDLGAVDRTLRNRGLLLVLGFVLGIGHRRILDYGGNDGLLARLMRDVGFNAYYLDEYETRDISGGFRIRDPEPTKGGWEVVTAFEVFEHLERPRCDLAKIFSLKPPFILISTRVYRSGYGETWDYLAPELGQHVFFFSEEALRRVAADYGYRLCSNGSLHLFIRNDRKGLRAFVARICIGRVVPRIGEVMSALVPSGKYIRYDVDKVRRTWDEPDS